MIIITVFAPTVGIIISGALRLNSALNQSFLQSILLPAMGASGAPSSAITAWFRNMFGPWICFGFLFPAIGFAITGLAFGLMFMLYLRLALITLLYMVSPLLVILLLVPKAREWAMKTLTILGEAIFMLIFFNMALLVVVVMTGMGSSFGFGGWGGPLVAMIAGVSFILVAIKLLHNPIGPAFANAAMGAAGAAFLGLQTGGGVASRIGKFGGRELGKWLGKSKGGEPGELIGGIGGGEADERTPFSERAFAHAEKMADNAYTSSGFFDLLGDFGRQAEVLGAFGAGLVSIGARKMHAGLTKLGAEEKMAGAPIREALAKKGITPSIATRFADWLEKRAPALGGIFGALGNKMDLAKLKKTDPKAAIFTKADYNYSKANLWKEGRREKIFQKAGFSREEQETLQKADPVLL
ncbi:MAG: hypothetical protein AB1485_09390, partial [Candidatus Thermoplasmatota archaeon]